MASGLAALASRGGDALTAWSVHRRGASLPGGRLSFGSNVRGSATKSHPQLIFRGGLPGLARRDGFAFVARRGEPLLPGGEPNPGGDPDGPDVYGPVIIIEGDPDGYTPICETVDNGTTCWEICIDPATLAEVSRTEIPCPGLPCTPPQKAVASQECEAKCRDRGQRVASCMCTVASDGTVGGEPVCVPIDKMMFGASGSPTGLGLGGELT